MIPGIPELEEVNKDTSEQTEEGSYMFADGTVITRRAAIGTAFNDTIHVWHDSSVKQQCGYHAELPAFYHPSFKAPDSQRFTFTFGRKRLQICPSHITLSYKKGSNAKTNSPIFIDSQSVQIAKAILRTHKGHLGVMIDSETECDSFRECQLKTKYLKESKRKRAEKKTKTGNAKKSSFKSVKRREAAASAGLDEATCDAIESDGDAIALLMGRIGQRHPILDDSPHLKMEYALLIYDGKATLGTLPKSINKQLKALRARKRKYHNIMNDLGCMDEGAADEDEDIHEPPAKKARIDQETLELLHEIWKQEKKKANHN